VGEAVNSRTFRPFDNSVVAHAVFDSSGGLLAVTPPSGSVRVYDTEGGHVTHSFPLRQDLLITSIAFHPDTNAMLLYIGCEDGSIHCFDLATRAKKPVFSVNHHVSAVVSFAFVNSDRWLISASTDRILSVSKSRNGESIHLIVTDEVLSGVEPLSGLKDAVITAGERGVLRVWDVNAGTEISRLASPIPLVSVAPKTEIDYREDEDNAEEVGIVPTCVSGLIRSGEREYTISLSDQTVISFSEYENGNLVATRASCGNIEQVNDLRILPSCVDGTSEITTPTDPDVTDGLRHCDVMVASNSNVIWIMQPPEDAFDARRTQKKLVQESTESGEKDRGHIVDNPALTAGQDWKCSDFLSGHRGIVLALDSVSLAGKNQSKGRERSRGNAYAASASRDKTARFWNRNSAGTWKCMGIAEGHTDAVTAVALSPATSPESFFAVTGANDRTVKLWSLQGALSRLKPDFKDDDNLEYMTLDQAPFIRAPRDPDSDSLKEASHTKDLPSEREDLMLAAKWTVLAHDKDINSVSVSPNGRLIGTGSQDRTVKVWDSVSGTLKITCRGHKRGVFDVRFSPVDKIIASASGDCTVRIWNVASGSCLRTFEGHAGGVLKTIFMRTGMQLASSGMDGLLKIWTVRTGECDLTLDAHDDSIWALDTAGDGASLISGGMDGIIHVWNDSTQVLAAASAEKKDKEALLTQRVNDAVLRRKWAPAADAALQLDMPRKLKSVITEIINTTENAEEELRIMIRALSEKAGSKEKLGRLLSYCRDWNAAGGISSAAVAAYVLQAVFSLWPPSRLSDAVTADKRGLVEGLVAHTDRHHARVASLAARVHFLDYTLTTMRGLAETPTSDQAGRRSKTREGADTGSGHDTDRAGQLKRRKKGHAGEATAY
jgi:U3 small nucleolar RNA-associated protein 13